MKKILAFCILYFVTISVYADTCPQPPRGYKFSVGAWGDHKSEEGAVRCHYYLGSDHIEYRAGWVTKAAFLSHWQWGDMDKGKYFLCSGEYVKSVNDCPFN